jgi:sulfoxide reductase heme-binding subunit YedZ
MAFLILLALAVTSSNSAVRRLGRRWKALHRGAYVAALLGVVHFWWLVKADIAQPALFALVFAVLMVARYKTTAFRSWIN